MFIHMLLCLISPAFTITEAEALPMARKYCEWRKYYPATVDGKTTALLVFLGSLAKVEAPRVQMAIVQKAAQKRQAQAAKAAERGQTARVVPIMPGA